jgi:hypothetical protein
MMKIANCQWKCFIINPNHTHSSSTGSNDHPGIRRRERTGQIADFIKDCFTAGITLQDTWNAVLQQWPSMASIRKDIENERKAIATKQREGRTALQHLLLGLDEDFLSYSKQDSTDKLTHLAFFGLQSLELWRLHPDILLIDSTYKTNRFDLPLVNIVGSTTNNRSFFVGSAFIQTETTSSFIWLLECIQELYKQAELPDPRIIITDADQALTTAITVIFPTTQHLWCVWHVNKAVQAFCKRLFKTTDYHPEIYSIPAEAIASLNQINKKWKDLEQTWHQVIYAPTEIRYHQAWDTFKQDYASNQAIIQYLSTTWLSPGKARRIIRCFTDQYLHFGNATTSRLEGMHRTLKQRLLSSQSDIPGVIQAFRQLLRDNNLKIRHEENQQRILRHPSFKDSF